MPFVFYFISILFSNSCSFSFVVFFKSMLFVWAIVRSVPKNSTLIQCLLLCNFVCAVYLLFFFFSRMSFWSCFFYLRLFFIQLTVSDNRLWWRLVMLLFCCYFRCLFVFIFVSHCIGPNLSTMIATKIVYKICRTHQSHIFWIYFDFNGVLFSFCYLFYLQLVWTALASKKT